VLRKTQSVVCGSIASKHTVQLFDAQLSLADAVSAFLAEGFDANARLLVVARPANWSAIAHRLERGGYPVARALQCRELTVCDASETLAKFMRQGRVIPHLYDLVVGELVAQLNMRSEHGLRIYGEMVDILAAERNFDAVQLLEDLWNGLAARQSFTLLCGYSAAHFASAETAHRLADICGQHTHVVPTPDDPLASWVLDREYDRPRARVAAAGSR
jgi:MEDS: MEthanogen/methylotroph, DcmR Sensory domain